MSQRTFKAVPIRVNEPQQVVCAEMLPEDNPKLGRRVWFSSLTQVSPMWDGQPDSETGIITFIEGYTVNGGNAFVSVMLKSWVDYILQMKELEAELDFSAPRRGIFNR